MQFKRVKMTLQPFDNTKSMLLLQFCVRRRLRQIYCMELKFKKKKKEMNKQKKPHSGFLNII